MDVRTDVPARRDGKNEMRPTGTVFDMLQGEIDRLFNNYARVSPGDSITQLVPSVDVSESDKEIELTAELPGLEQNDVEIAVEDNVLTIRGEKKAETKREDKNFRVMERAYGSFYRAFTLPSGVEPSQISATMSNGVLKIKIPKPQQPERKKIEVKKEN